jgi:hypothetical protein
VTISGHVLRPLGRNVSRYLFIVLVLNLIWETAQVPLYTLWWTAPAGYIVFALLHCTAGDVLIAAGCLLAAIVLFGATTRWPDQDFVQVMLFATTFGVLFTAFSEWLNVYVRENWAYTASMPLIPGLGIGLAPVLQWVIVPPVSAALARRRRSAHPLERRGRGS